MVDRLALIAKARGAIGHQALPLRRADRAAQIGFAAQAHLTLPTFRRVERDDVVTRHDRGHASTHFAHHAGAFMAKNARKQPFAVQPIERVGIGVAQAGRHDFDQHFARSRAFEIKLDDLQRLLGFKCYGGTGLHGRSLQSLRRERNTA